ncbi:acyl-CoA dehydrogenase C-terminal domain-containing protein [Deinococcus deserti]|uniref:3-methylmercaptopropionyl-CoA dehydrogenase n=1 Tax=Deinococcus deserti (strain DSM 17065 / CIP 109153 / LMG 22923 / VCD115) TaxID=546414 RepID=C1D052_DEIDV|nr:acyl-CoA dehydrogenase C-terminal domain-containing protein [Deinococcus deserti]ACO47321.1 putative acyl-CoA dehydrogenase [Deinococcus deserti VCD115]
MPTYKAPLRDMKFIMNELLDAPAQLSQMPFYTTNETADADLMTQVLEEAARFVETELVPLNRVGDQEGCTRDEQGNVTTPTGFKAAYRKYREAGWTALDADPAYGGQGMPHLVSNMLVEMMCSANVAWSMYPGLSHGAYSALHAVGSDELKNLYLPKIVSGEWTGTMCLTEPHAGTDLGMIRTRATDNGDGSYSVTGTKIFISAGEHDMADNIVHLVLARLEGSPEGTKGISLFVVPKFVPSAEGGVGERNGVVCGSLEHKMGIHGNATAVLNFDGAKGWLVGEVNKGMNHMFIMMNAARLGTGLQGLGLGEGAYQNALVYAKDRIQMRHTPRVSSEPADPIIVHPDVRRMLLTGKAYTEAGRALAMWLALSIDTEHHHPDEARRKEAADLVALLTPIAKAFMTDNGFHVAVQSQQIYGGHGYIQEWGMEQFVRDARIGQIYEGTNGIQALDLLGRKVLMDGGKKLQKLAGTLQEFAEAHEDDEHIGEYVNQLGKAAQQLGSLTMVIGQKAMGGEGGADEVNAAAVDYLRYFGHVVYGYLWARMAKTAQEKIDAGADRDGFYLAKVQTARFYFAKLFPETKTLAATIKAGNEPLAVDDQAVFGWEAALALA